MKFFCFLKWSLFSSFRSVIFFTAIYFFYVFIFFVAGCFQTISILYFLYNPKLSQELRSQAFIQII